MKSICVEDIKYKSISYFIMTERMYLLYLSQNNQIVENTIFLGIGSDPVELYQNALNPQTANKKDKSLILNWLTQVEAKLDEQEKKEMDYAFMKNPETEFSYSIKDMTLYIKLIKKY